MIRLRNCVTRNINIIVTVVAALMLSGCWPGISAPPTDPTTPQQPPTTGCPENPCVIEVHVTSCTNAVDGTPSEFFTGACAWGCGTTCQEAEQNALIALESSGFCFKEDTPGCCKYEANQNFNYCGGK